MPTSAARRQERSVTESPIYIEKGRKAEEDVLNWESIFCIASNLSLFAKRWVRESRAWSFSVFELQFDRALLRCD